MKVGWDKVTCPACGTEITVSLFGRRPDGDKGVLIIGFDPEPIREHARACPAIYLSDESIASMTDQLMGEINELLRGQ